MNIHLTFSSLGMEGALFYHMPDFTSSLVLVMFKKNQKNPHFEKMACKVCKRVYRALFNTCVWKSTNVNFSFSLFSN